MMSIANVTWYIGICADTYLSCQDCADENRKPFLPCRGQEWLSSCFIS